MIITFYQVLLLSVSHGGEKKAHVRDLSGKIWKKGHLEDLGVDGKLH
jgi:hypothetical protein